MSTKQLPSVGSLVTIKCGDEVERAAAIESYEWTFMGTEIEKGHTFALLTREEPRSLDDVYNGSGTGLGMITVTERVNLGVMG